MPYYVHTIPTNDKYKEFMYQSKHMNYFSALKKHIKVNYETIRSVEIEYGDYLINIKLLLRSLCGLKTNWEDIGLSAENKGTIIVFSKNE